MSTHLEPPEHGTLAPLAPAEQAALRGGQRPGCPAVTFTFWGYTQVGDQLLPSYIVDYDDVGG